MMTKTCGFCGGPGVTKEHLWPDWLRKIIVESRGGGKGKKFDAEFERDGEVKKFKTLDMETRVSMPCGKCNHGWMNDLENSVKPFLERMTFPGGQTFLDPERCLALSRWFVKVAMVFEFTGDKKYFREDERRQFKELYAMPETVWIWAGRYDGPRPVHGVERRAWSEGRLVEASAYCLTITAGFVVLQLLAHRKSAPEFSQFAAATRDNILLRVFPSPSAAVTWPPEKTIDDYGLIVLDDRFVDIVKERRG